MEEHERITILTAIKLKIQPDTVVIRDADGLVSKKRGTKDATPEEQQVKEINTGTYRLIT